MFSPHDPTGWLPYHSPLLILDRVGTSVVHPL